MAWFLDSILDLLFPPRCGGCGSWGKWFCDDCLKAIRFLKEPHCRFCGNPAEDWGICPSCAREPHSLEGIISVAYFEGPIQKVVHLIKYQGKTALVSPLTELMASRILRNPVQAEGIIPVPLHPSRYRERGFNQSALLAEGLSKHLGIPVLDGALERIRYTRPQVGLNAQERKENVKGAFRANPFKVAGKNLIVVDDVCTTGATLEECGVALKEAGAKRVWGITLARAP
ncbi:MAG: ComF family protein [Anaerolineae bacterium]|nr:ComF family protein [Anaerolineae bacterium]MDW8102859.1 ComF family protein [Anaerolineae bacterium]